VQQYDVFCSLILVRPLRFKYVRQHPAARYPRSAFIHPHVRQSFRPKWMWWSMSIESKYI